MSRLVATLRLDTQLQARNKVYLVVVLGAAAVAVALARTTTPDQLRFWMPVLVLGSVTPTTVLLVGMLLQFERSEGMLDVALVSPLRPGEYLASKMATLGILALVESSLLAGVAYGSGLVVPWLVLAVLLRATLGVAVGVAIGVHYSSFLRWLVPAIFVGFAFDLPVFWYLEIWPSKLLFLLPTMPSLVLAKAAFQPVDPATAGYGLAYGFLATSGAVLWARRAIDRYVVRAGERRR